MMKSNLMSEQIKTKVLLNNASYLDWTHKRIRGERDSYPSRMHKFRTCTYHKGSCTLPPDVT